MQALTRTRRAGVLLCLASLTAAASGQNLPCGEFIPNTDLPGDNLPGSGTQTFTNEACMDLCMDLESNSPPCNAMIQTPEGFCYLKNVPLNGVPSTKAGLTSFIVCPDEPTPVPAPAPIEFEYLQCGQVLSNTDLTGSNLPGSRTQTPNNQACLNLCESNPPCNAAIRTLNGKCFMKNVPLDVASITKGGATAYVICPEASLEPAPVPAPVPAPAPVTPPSFDNVACGGFSPNTDLPGDNLSGSGTQTSTNQACMDLCESTPPCNAIIQNPNGKCFLKNVPLDVVPSTKAGLTSFVMCPTGIPAPTPEPTPPPAPAPMPAPPESFDNLQCGQLLTNTDLPGSNLEHSRTQTPDDQACKELCRNYPPCNAAMRLPNGLCFLKDVPSDVVPNIKAGATSYVFCPEEIFFAEDSCPDLTPKLSTGLHKEQLFVKPAARAAYLPPGELSPINDLFEITLGYPTIKNGEKYCFIDSPGNSKVLVGGSLVFKDNGACVDFPTQANGDPCCTIFTWQPNSDGYYYDNCSMKIFPDENGVWFFRTEIPGDESLVGWGPDAHPHFHFDVECGNCAANSALGTSDLKWWNKFYANDICTTCGATDAGHLAEKSTFNWEETHKYNIVIDIAAAA